MFNRNLTLPSGSACVLISGEGEMTIQHNIEGFDEATKLDGETMAPALMALTLAELLNDEEIFDPALKKVGGMVAELLAKRDRTVN